MMKGLKKINGKRVGAMVLTGAMVIGMSQAAFAAEGNNTQEGNSEAVNIQKELTAYNPDGSTVYAPTISYGYTITAGDANASITDESGIQVLTKAGVINGLKVNNTSGTTGTVAWTNADELKTAEDGETNIKNLEIDFSNVDFGGAGVYRYVITEAIPDYAAAGVTETDGDHNRILDVYVKDGSGTGADAWNVYGFICFDDNETTVVTATEKTTGFVTETETDGTGAAAEVKAADSYYTYNLEVSKTLVGDNAKKNNKFDFNVAFINTNVTNNILLKAEANNAADVSTPATGAINGLNSTAGIANEGTVTYTGIPAGTQVNVYETNNVTGTTYQSAYQIDDATAAGAKNIAWTGDDAKSNTATVTTDANVAADAHTIGFINTLQQISPTGVAMRYGAYMLILAAGIVLLALGRRRKMAAEEA